MGCSTVRKREIYCFWTFFFISFVSGHLYGLQATFSPKDAKISQGRFILHCMAIEAARKGVTFSVKYPLLAGCFMASQVDSIFTHFFFHFLLTFCLQVAMESYRGVDDILNGTVGGSVAFGAMMIPYGVRSIFAGLISGVPCGVVLALVINGATTWRKESTEILTSLSPPQESSA